MAATSTGSRRWFGLRFLAVYAIWLACFQAVGRFAATLPTSDLTSAVDRAIPFEPRWVWADELCYVLPLLPLLPLAVVREEVRFARALLAFAVANVTAFAVYLALPVAWPPTDPGSTLAGRVLALSRRWGKRLAGVGLDAYLGKQLKDGEFRLAYEQRRLVHEVAIVVRSMREQAGRTQAQLAKMVGVSQPMIARMERGLAQRTPRWETLRKIGLALGKQLKLSFLGLGWRLRLSSSTSYPR